MTENLVVVQPTRMTNSEVSISCWCPGGFLESYRGLVSVGILKELDSMLSTAIG